MRRSRYPNRLAVKGVGVWFYRTKAPKEPAFISLYRRAAFWRLTLLCSL
jgi:hypothetical protein